MFGVRCVVSLQITISLRAKGTLGPRVVQCAVRGIPSVLRLPAATTEFVVVALVSE